MSFSREWDQRFAQGGNRSLWPWSDLVSAVMRYAKPFPGMRVLELGCGVGANARFFIESQCVYHAIEGSESAVAIMRDRFPELGQRLRAADFTKGLTFEGAFDLIVDRSAVTHNPHAAIARTLSFANQALKEGGWYIGIDWFSNAHGDALDGSAAEDEHTRCRFEAGQFAGVGCVHFAGEPEMRELFSGFDLICLEHKMIERREPAGKPLATWNVVAQSRAARPQ